jgi:methionyl-tRNA formyltransferase
MRVVFMGTTEFSCVVLNQLLLDGYNVVGVVTQPDRPFGRKRVLKASAVKEMALAHHIEVVQPVNIRKEKDLVLNLKPDLIVTCAYGQIVPKAILDYPKFKSLNVHASLLPKYRGGAPIHKSIINGDTETGVTLMLMDVGMDSGDMIAKRSVDIAFEDSFGDVEAKLMEVSKDLVHADLPKYLDKTLVPIKQDDAEVTHAYAITRDEEFISFKKAGLSVYNHIRGLVPWPVGYGVLEDMNIKLHGAVFVEKDHDYEFGLVLDVNHDGVVVAVDGGYITLTKVQPSGKPVLNMIDVVNGYGQLWKGKVFL